MSKDTGTTSFFEKLATFIVDKRNLIFFLYACALIFCLFSRSWVRVCNDITEYLPDTTETRQGLTLMEEEFTTFATARVMVSHVTYEMAEDLAEQMEQIEGVSSAVFGSSDVGADTEEDSEPETPEDIAEYFKGADALISVTFEGEEEDEVSLAALSSIRELLAPYDFYIDSAVGNSQAASLANEMGIILAVAAVIIVLVLLLTSRSYAEIPVLLLTFVAAAVLNLGTNFIFGEISFVSNSVTVVLQLALAIDYAIIMLHRFLEEREYAGDREACIAAVSASIPSISASSLTTISGLAAMMFMQFQIGFDMGIVLIKAILFSMLSVFTLMPGLLMLFSKAMEKTRHRSFIPKIDRWGKLTLKLRYVGAPLFVVAVVAGFLLSNQCPYVYGYSQIETARQNETQIAERRVNETFGTQNIMALLVPKGDYASEKALLDRLESYDQVDYAMGLSNVEVMDGYTLTDAMTPRQFSEMTDLDYDLVCLLYTAYAAEGEEYGRIVGGLNDYAVPLMDMFFFAYDKAEEGYVNLDEEQQADLDDLYQQLSDARKQLLGDTYTRMLISLDLPEEGEETFAFLRTIHREAERYYDADHVYLVGDSTSDYDLSVSFDQRAVGGVCYHCPAVHLPVSGAAPPADPGDSGQHLDQFLLPRHHPAAHFLYELSGGDLHSDGCQHRLRHRHLLLVQRAEREHVPAGGHHPGAGSVLPHGAHLGEHPVRRGLFDWPDHHGARHRGHRGVPVPGDVDLHVSGHVHPAPDPVFGGPGCGADPLQSQGAGGQPDGPRHRLCERPGPGPDLRRGGCPYSGRDLRRRLRHAGDRKLSDQGGFKQQ